MDYSSVDPDEIRKTTKAPPASSRIPADLVMDALAEAGVPQSTPVPRDSHARHPNSKMWTNKSGR